MKNRIIVGTILVLFVLNYSHSANQQTEEIKKRIAKCASIKDDLERLKCYDQLARDLDLFPASSTKPTVAKGKWISNVSTNPIDDSKTVTLALLAEEGESTYGEKIALLIRCKSSETELFINWRSYLGSEAYVLTRIGSEKPTRQAWSLSTDSKATFYQGNDIAFIRKLMTADRLVAQVTPYGENPITAIFDVRGLKESIKPLQEVCGWK